MTRVTCSNAPAGNRPLRRLLARSTFVLAVAVLAACGGNDYDDTPPPAIDPLDAVPDSALASAGGMVDYLGVLAGNLSDSREPIDLGALALPLSDTSEPLPVD